jgi:glycosyltransferase involved in cell wall biosynthesis
MINLSVVVPCYYSEATIERLCDSVVASLQKQVGTMEVVLVNDGSTDKTGEACRSAVSRYPGIVKYVELARNFSEHNAVMAGLSVAKGNFAVIIDDDFQNPPEEILVLYNRCVSTGADVVYSRYEKKYHHWMRNLGSVFNDKVANVMLRKPPGLYLSSFKLLRRRLIDQILDYRGPIPYIDGLILRATSHIEVALVSHSSRAEGKSNYSARKLMALWSNMFINFSILPLRLALYLGFVFSFVGLVGAVLFIWERLSHPDLPVGWASVMVALLIFSGVQLLVLGLIGEFLGRLYLNQTGQPQFVIRETVV